MSRDEILDGLTDALLTLDVSALTADDCQYLLDAFEHVANRHTAPVLRLVVP